MVNKYLAQQTERICGASTMDTADPETSVSVCFLDKNLMREKA